MIELFLLACCQPHSTAVAHFRYKHFIASVFRFVLIYLGFTKK